MIIMQKIIVLKKIVHCQGNYCLGGLSVFCPKHRWISKLIFCSVNWVCAVNTVPKHDCRGVFLLLTINLLIVFCSVINALVL